MSRRPTDTVCSADDLAPVWVRFRAVAIRELPAWRNFALTSLLTVTAWWLIVAVCLGQNLQTYRLSPAESEPLSRNLRQLFETDAPDSVFTTLVSNPGSKYTFWSGDTGHAEYSIDSLAGDQFAHANVVGADAGGDNFSVTSYESVYGEQMGELPGLTPDHVFAEQEECYSCCNELQLLPDGLLYQSYLAGPKESRLQWISMRDSHNREQIWEATLGGKIGLLRYGTRGAQNPQGFQLDVDGAVFARVLPDQPSSMLAASDYRVGLFGTWRRNRLAWKAGYYHISSHLGDEFLLANPGFPRLNYVRDSLVTGTSYDLTGSARIYGEMGYAVGHQGGAMPLEFQFGAQYTPVAQNPFRGAPFAGINNHSREDFGWVSGLNVVAGWGWQGPESARRLRIGMQYYNGPSLQYSFLNRHENLIGGGIWLDF